VTVYTTTNTALDKTHLVQAKTPGSIAVWIFIYAELTEFGLFFLAFFVAKFYFPEEFYHGPSQLNTMTGFLNTLVLLSSSFFVASAVQSIKRGSQRQSLIWLILTILAGISYCVIKSWEYSWNISMGITSRSNYFFTSYYYITFNHLLHVLIGICTMTGVAVLTAMGCFNARSHEGFLGAASYWHMIDLVWILIFPIVYVLR